MRHLMSYLILALLITGLGLLAAGCGGLETPPPPTVTRAPTDTPTIPATEPPGQRATPTAVLLTPTVEATPSPSPTATATPAPTSTPMSLAAMAAPTTALSQAVVREGPLNVRVGPGTMYPRIGQLAEGTEVQITGRNEDGSWWQITYEAGVDGRGWVSTEYIQTPGEITVEVVEAPPVPPTPRPAYSGKLVFQERSGGRIFIVHADGTGLRQLTHGLDPALSPDGTQVAFTRWEAPQGIYLINVDGTQERLLVRVEQAKSPEWSPDGTKITFTHRSGGGFVYYWDSEKGRLIKQEDPHWKIAVADVATGKFIDVFSEEHSFSPSWSPDGWWVVYDGEQGLMLTDPTGQSKRWHQVTYSVRDMSPDWSPEPRDNPWAARIAYMVYHNDHWEIHTVLPDGQGNSRLTPNTPFEPPWDSVAPEWSPDGRWIAYLSDRRGQWEIWVMRADGSQQRPLLTSSMLGGISFHYEAQSEQVLDWGP